MKVLRTPKGYAIAIEDKEAAIFFNSMLKPCTVTALLRKEFHKLHQLEKIDEPEVITLDTTQAEKNNEIHLFEGTYFLAIGENCKFSGKLEKL